MTIQQLLLSIGLPMLLVLIGILLNERNISNLRSDMKDMRKELTGELKEVRSRIDRIDSDLAHFFKVTGILEGRLDELSKR
jgi:hypothetical protein